MSFRKSEVATGADGVAFDAVWKSGGIFTANERFAGLTHSVMHIGCQSENADFQGDDRGKAGQRVPYWNAMRIRPPKEDAYSFFSAKASNSFSYFAAVTKL